MIKTAILILSISFGLLATSVVSADVQAPVRGPEIARFFQLLADDWEGAGIDSELSNGSWVQNTFWIDFEMDESERFQWKYDAEINQIGERSERDSSRISLIGNQLYVDKYSLFEPVTEVTGNGSTLSFAFEGRDSLSGKSYRVVNSIHFKSQNNITWTTEMSLDGTLVAKRFLEAERD